MHQQGSQSPIDIANSLLAWWREAGVEYVSDGEPMNWLAAPEAVPVRVEPVSAPALTAVLQHVLAPAPVLNNADWPNELPALHAMIRDGAPLPGNGYGSAHAVPVGPANPQFMVITDCPDETELAAGKLGEGPTALLLRAMLAAAGVAFDDCYLAALAHSRPASGSLPKGDHAQLAAFVSHHIGLVKPQKLILLGSAAAEILLGKELMEARANLPDFNHHGRNMAAVTTFHPRTLMARPVLKAQAWKDLQMLAKKDHV